MKQAVAERERRPQSDHIQFRRILVATDFSATSLKELGVAITLTKKLGAEMHIVHVVPAGLFANPLVASPLDAGTMKGVGESMRQLSAHPLLAGIKHQIAVCEGVLVKELQRYVDENEIDVIVTGTAGRKGMQKLLLGSAAEDIVRHISCPVMIVGPRVRKAPITYRSISLATSLACPTSLRAAKYAVALAEKLGAYLTLVHIAATGDSGEMNDYTRDSINRQLRNLLPPVCDCWCRPKVRTVRGAPATQILASAAEDAVDMIVMSSHDDGVFGDHASWSVLTDVVRDAKCPVLAVRAHFE